MTEATLYPIFLHNLAGRRVVVVGGGRVGERKVAGLLPTAARICLISPVVTTQVNQWAADGALTWLARPFQPGDLAGAYLVFAATDDRSVNAQVGEEARTLGVLCNLADAPDEGDFHLPAIHRETGWTIAVGTGGRSPAHAKWLRDQIAAALRTILTRTHPPAA